jgi:tRNA-uridine 2-sulfurtransferase
LSKQAGSNALVVGTQEELGVSEIMVRDVNWSNGRMPQGPFRAQVKTRYTAKEVPALVCPLAGDSPEGTLQASVVFDAPVRDATAGQAAVFYQDELLIGGGIIVQ